jgi:hypothetical protein
VTFICEVRAGQLVPIDPSAWVLGIRKLEGKRVQVDVEPYRKSRSAQQSRYYFGVIVAILGDEWGYKRDEMHAALAHKFLGSVDENTGLMRIKSTKDLSTVEMEDYLASIREWASLEYRILIPLPNEYSHQEMRQATTLDSA